MHSNAITKTVLLPDGREISIETGKLAKQADGAVVLKMGKTMLLATVVSSPEPREGADFLPLSVDYQEKFAAAGKIPGGFLKREGRLSDYEVLASRLVDRAIRPMFPEHYYCDTQINIQLISADLDANPTALAALAASSALMVSDIPFAEPISEVQVVRHKGEFVVNPTKAQLQHCDLDLVVAATMTDILMVEGQMDEVSEDDMLEALKVAHEAIKPQCAIQKELEKAAKAEEKRSVEPVVQDEELREEIFDNLYGEIYAIAASAIGNKSERKEAFDKVKQEYIDSLPEEDYDLDLVKRYIKEIEKKSVRKLVLQEKVRLDGRAMDEVRPIWAEVDYLPAAHGSAVFTRGETQSLTSVTLGTKLDEKIIDRALYKGSSKFILHYNFPGFSTGEVKPNRGPARREIGHGNLAHRAVSGMIPEDIPYTVRVVSDILESNGSSSMATVCAASMAMMDAGVALKAPVSGIAMGMISDAESGEYAILSDILGDEDHLGDMDFKVTGTAKGITACQMDIKIAGLPYEVLRKALLQAKEGRMHILEKITQVIDKPRAELKPHAPRFMTLEIDKEMIGAVIGPGGKIVQEIQKESGATIVIEENNEVGLVNIFSENQSSLNDAVGRIKAIVALPEVGEVYDGIVKSVTAFGAFIEFMKGKEGLLHISEISWQRTERMEGVMEVGEEVKVKLIDVDRKTGKYRLSRKVLLPKPQGFSDDPPNRPRRHR